MTPAPVPDVLYKYLSPERIDILENMQVRFSAPSDFNDTFDADYLVPISQGQKAKTARMLLRSRLGIFCLTEQPNDHLMWVHYAQKHTGFILGFDAKASFFSDGGRKLDKVKYRTGPQVLDEANVDVCYYKSRNWAYEKEWRCVRQFERSESRFVAIEPSLITHIIFGFKMEAWQIARVMLYATACDMISRTRFLVSTPLRKSWTFENKRKRVSLCDTCIGYGYLMEEEAASE